MPAHYDKIGKGYDATRHADPRLAAWLAELLGIRADGRYLDVACGTGNYTNAVLGAASGWCGLDLSSRMLVGAAEKAPGRRWIQANAERIPFPCGTFVGALITLALHHFIALRPVFREVRRVLAEGALVIFTGDPDLMRRFWLTEYFPRQIHRAAARMPDRERVVTALRDSGFAHVEVEPFEVPDDLEDLFLYCGKRRPELYLHPAVRSGISSFASLSDPAELDRGLARLASDIRHGRFPEVAERYAHEEGDYLVIRAAD